MSAEPRSPSRRAILRAIGLSPLALIGASSLSAATLERISNFASVQGCREDQKEKIKKIGERLMHMFKLGAKGAPIDEPAVEAKGWELSGKKLCERIDDWPDGDKDHDETIGCAFLCGWKARELAGGKVINDAVFEDAWNWTRAQRHTLFSRARRVAWSAGGDPSKSLGLGC